MEIRGLGNGLAVFLVEPRIFYRTKDGYEGVDSFPTFYVVGGTEEDAIKNAVGILSPYHRTDGSQFLNFSISAVNADPDAPYRMVTHCAHRFCNTCGEREGIRFHRDTGHEFHHTCIDNICSVIVG